LFSVPFVGTAQNQVPVAPQTATPPRDQTQRDSKGTSGLKGKVVEGDTGKPLRRAKVSVTAVDVPNIRKDVSTGLDGVYEFKDLPAATYKISVTRSGYLALDYGQRRPGELGRPVELADGQVLDKLDFALPRMGVITGQVADERGDPIEGVTVLTMRSLFLNGHRSLVPIGSSNVLTDDIGEYRVPRLPPGTYYVQATTRETWKVVENGKDVLLGYMPTYFPGVAKVGEARRVTVGVGQQVSGIDLSLVPGRTARVSGRAVDSQGAPFKQVSMNQEIRGVGFASFRGGPSGSVSSDGSFTIADVPPGDYVMNAARMDTEGNPEVAITSVTVDGTDIENVTLTGSAGGTVMGHVVTDEDGLTMTSMRVTIGAVIQGQASPVVLSAFRNGGFASVKADGSFSVNHVFGSSRFQVTLPSGWMVKSITHDGHDIADTVFELASGATWNDIEIRVTKRTATISGDILNAQNEAVTSATVVLFAADSEKWFESSRYVRAARPNQQGRWHVGGLPEGDYLVAAVDYIENGEWNDPEYLATLRDVATRVSIPEGESRTVRLTLVAPK
jgi:hypothetical protein